MKVVLCSTEFYLSTPFTGFTTLLREIPYTSKLADCLIMYPNVAFISRY